jgi:hypothetical protein
MPVNARPVSPFAPVFLAAFAVLPKVARADDELPTRDDDPLAVRPETDEERNAREVERLGPNPTTLRLSLGFPVFPVGLGLEQQLGPHLSVGLDATANFVAAFHGHLRAYALTGGRVRFYAQPGVSHIFNPAIGNTSDVLELRAGFDVRTGPSSTFSVDAGVGSASGSFMSGTVPVLAIAWGHVFGHRAEP